VAIKKLTDIERFHRSYIVQPNGCWLWTLAVDKDGYGSFKVGSRTDSSRRNVRAHRWSYETFVKPLDDDMVPDHLCRTPGCVNWAHLEAVTPVVNTQRGSRATATHCPYGHPYTGENLLIIKSSGRRRCRTCRRRAIRDHGIRTNWSAQRAFKERKRQRVTGALSD